jgi:pectate lyase
MRSWTYLGFIGAATFSAVGAYAAMANEKPVGWASQNGGTTGGSGGTEVTVKTMDALNAELKKEGKIVIWIDGTLTGRADIPTNDKSILGLPGAKIVGGMDMTGSSSKILKNIILRNFEIEGPGANDVDGVDALTIQYATNVWVDHLYIRDGLDGNLDITNEADLITVSNTKFAYLKGGNHRFCNLIGSSDSKTGDRGKLRVTFIGNWWAEGVMERMPRVRFGKVHMVNNLFRASGNNHCVRAGLEADIRIEGNAFVNVKEPIDQFDGDFTAVTETNNLYTNISGNRNGRGNAFSPPYTLTIASPNSVERAVSNAATGAGPNLKWGQDPVVLRFEKPRGRVRPKGLQKGVAETEWVVGVRNEGMRTPFTLSP